MSDLEMKSRNLSIISIAVVLLGIIVAFIHIKTDETIPTNWYTDEHIKSLVFSTLFGLASMIGIVGIVLSSVSLYALSLEKSKKILLYVLALIAPITEVILFILSNYYKFLLKNA